LTKSQKNDIFEALMAGGIDPAACSLNLEDVALLRAGDEIERRRGVRIDHPSSGSHFKFHQEGGSFIGDTSVGDDPPPQVVFAEAKWTDVLKFVFHWAEHVNEYVKMPDLWADLQQTRDALGDAQSWASENAPFTPAEQSQISNQLREIRVSLQENFRLTGEQLSQVGQGLDEAEEASNRLGRKDWVMLFTGAVFSLMITGTVTPDVAQHILTVTLHGLTHLFLSGMKPLSGPHTK
jgi:hypothetical protein